MTFGFAVTRIQCRGANGRGGDFRDLDGVDIRGDDARALCREGERCRPPDALRRRRYER